MPGGIPGRIPGGMPGAIPWGMPGAMPGGIPGTMPGGIPRTIPGRIPGGIPGTIPGGIRRTMPGCPPGDTMPCGAIPGGAMPGGGAAGAGAGSTGISPPPGGRSREEPGAAPADSGPSAAGRAGGGGPSGCQITNGASSPPLPRPASGAFAGVLAEAFTGFGAADSGETTGEDWAAAGPGARERAPASMGAPAMAVRGSRASRLHPRRKGPRGAGRPMAARKWCTRRYP